MQVDLAPVLQLFAGEVPDLAGVYLFGSYGAGTARAESDLDLALFAGRPIPRALLLELREQVERLTRRDVDLIDLAAADTVLQMQVIGEGRLLEALDPKSVGLFELRVLRDYRDLKRRRVGIDADIVARGRVHA